MPEKELPKIPIKQIVQMEINNYFNWCEFEGKEIDRKELTKRITRELELWRFV